MGTFISRIILAHRTSLESAGLLHRPGTVQIPPAIARMRTSPRKAMAALREQATRPSIQASPFNTLFEVTLPAIEVALIELGEDRAEEIVGRLVEHGQAMIRDHGMAGVQEHLEELFGDLPKLDAKLRGKNGTEEIIDAYRKLHFDERAEDYLRLVLGEKIQHMVVDEQGMIWLKMKYSTTDSDLVILSKAKNIKDLSLREVQVADISPLASLANLQTLDLLLTQVADISPLASLANLQTLNLQETQVAAISPLASLANLQKLDLAETQVSDLTPLASLANLQKLDLRLTRVADISPLASLANLQKLDLAGTQVAAISPLANLANLQTLNLRNTQVADLSPLDNLANLQKLDVAWTQIADAQVEELKEANPSLEVKR